MKVGLLVTSIGNFGQKGFYNAQEIGLAKELDKLVDEVVIYKLLSKDQNAQTEAVDGCRHTTLHCIPARSLGINGVFDVNKLDAGLDALIYFSDTQPLVPSVAKWAKKNHVALYPYIGVLESHSTNTIVKRLINGLFKRNLAVYRKQHCFVKTPDVEKRLRELGVAQVTVTPVGLDISLLHKDAEQVDPKALKAKYGYQANDRVLLFIGRFVAEKEPMQMVEIFSEIYNKDNRYRLLMVGTGELREAVEEKVEALRLSEEVRFVDKIPNSDIWELYRMADAFVNLNRQEIFGMAILEAMYYGCKVVAMHAPGPDYIIESSVSGYLTSTNQEMITAIQEPDLCAENAKKRILENFTWGYTAEKIVSILRK